MSAHAIAYSIALSLHVAAGSAGLALGPVAMFSAKRRGVHTRAGEAYYYVFILLFVTSVALAALDFKRAWWLALIGAGSFGFAYLGYRAGRRRGPNWLPAHVSGQGGSYIALVTALLVVNLNAISGAVTPAIVVAWFVPGFIGGPLIAWVNFQIAAGKRPKAWRRKAVQLGST